MASEAISSRLANVRGPSSSAVAPRCSRDICRAASPEPGVTSTSTARRTRSGRSAASAIVVRPPSDMPATAAARGACASITGATAAAFVPGP